MDRLKTENLQVLINPFLHEASGLSRKEFLNLLSEVKSIRTREEMVCLEPDLTHMKKLESLHRAVNTGMFNDILFERGHNFAIGLPIKLFEWLKNTHFATLQKQLLNFMAAFCVLNDLEEVYRNDLDPLVFSELNTVLPLYQIEAFDKDAEYQKHYYTICEKITGCLPPEIFDDPLFAPPINIDWGLVSQGYCYYKISYFTESDWLLIISRQPNKLIEKGFVKDKQEALVRIEEASFDAMLRTESDELMWRKWKYTFENYELRRSHVYSLLSIETPITGYIYLFQTESKEATKIGWTTKEISFRKAGLQTGNHEKIIERGHFSASSIKTETILHEMFQHKRVRPDGEWFNLTDEDITNILNANWRRQHNIF